MCAPEALVAKSLRRGERGLLSGAHHGDDPFAGIPSPAARDLPGRPEPVDRWLGLGRHRSGARSSPASGHRSLGFSMALIPRRASVATNV